MSKATDWVVVGCFGRPHGIKGFIRIHSFTDPRDNILCYEDWHLRIKQHWQLIELLKVEKNEKFILAQLRGYNTREELAALTNAEIAIRREQLPVLKEGEYYWHELIGLEVINKNRIKLGVVKQVMATGANDVLIVEGERRYLIPYLPEQFIMELNIHQGTIVVDWDVDF